MGELNILITSVGRRTKLVDYFKTELAQKGKVIAADCSKLAPGLYYADKYYIVPRINHPDYINIIKDICKKEKVRAVISLIDPELSLLAKNAETFKAIGVVPIVSSYEACELCLDKYAMYLFCREHGFKCAMTYNNIADFEAGILNHEIDFPVFIKPQKGSASLNISKAMNMDTVLHAFRLSDGLIVQEYLDGREIGADIYIDLITKKVTSIFLKEKLGMRAGETDKAISIKSDTLTVVLESLMISTGLIGPIDVDVFYAKGDYYISEINPRFGGGYPIAYECGLNFPKYIINNLSGIKNITNIGNYEENVYMLKHDILTVLKTG